MTKWPNWSNLGQEGLVLLSSQLPGEEGMVMFMGLGEILTLLSSWLQTQKETPQVGNGQLWSISMALHLPVKSQMQKVPQPSKLASWIWMKYSNIEAYEGHFVLKLLTVPSLVMQCSVAECFCHTVIPGPRSLASGFLLSPMASLCIELGQ